MAYFARAYSEYQAVANLLPQETVDSVKASLEVIQELKSTADLLMAAIILDIAGQPDRDLEAQATEAAQGWFETSISRADVFQARLLFDLYVELTGDDNLTLSFDLFDIDTEDDQKAAWTALSLARYAENGAEIEERYGMQRQRALELIADPGSSLVKDVYLAYLVAGADANLDLLSEGLQRWLISIQGCEYATHFYQADPGSGVCTLQATYQLMRLGLEDRV